MKRHPESFLGPSPVCMVKRFLKRRPLTSNALESSAEWATVDAEQSGSTDPYELLDNSMDDVSLPSADWDLSWLHDPFQDESLSTLLEQDYQDDPHHCDFADQDHLTPPRWSDSGVYNEAYNPSWFNDLLGPKSYAMAGSNPSAVLGSQPNTPLKHRPFHVPSMSSSSHHWPIPVRKKKSRTSLVPQARPELHQFPKLAPVATCALPQAQPDPALVTAAPQAPTANVVASMQLAWTSAKSDLINKWLDTLSGMGLNSGLMASTEGSSNQKQHCIRVIQKFAPSTLQAHLTVWNRWRQFADAMQCSPFHPEGSLLADFLAEHAHGPLQVATGYWKGLSWIARNAQLPALMDTLQSSLCRAYLKSDVIMEKRESAPLPLSFVVFLERGILKGSFSMGATLQLGAILFSIWSSLRWSDALWTAPATLCLERHALYAVASHTKTTNRGMPIACFAYGLLGSVGNPTWTSIWLNIVRQAMHDTVQQFPNQSIDFLLPEIGPDEHHPLFLKPLRRDRGLQLLRYWLCQCHLSFKSSATPADFHLLGTHSCKTTLLSWSQQLHLPLEQRQMQGHHRATGAGKSVALYSRSDTLPALTLQITIAQKLAEGFRPLRPMHRGGAPSVQDFAVTVPPWTPIPGVSSLEPVESQITPEADQLPGDVAVEHPEDDCSSASSESSSVEDASDAEPPQPSADQDPDEYMFVYNPSSRVAHCAVLSSADDKAAFIEDAEKRWWKAACGSKPNAISGDHQLRTDLPAGARLCLRKACTKPLNLKGTL